MATKKPRAVGQDPARCAVGRKYKISMTGHLGHASARHILSPASMTSLLKINFYNQHFIVLKRIDPMRPMDLGDGPEMLELTVTVPRNFSETTWSPLFGTRSLYTGYLYDGSTSRSVFIKWGRSKHRMEELKKEGDFYCSALRKLQGVVVPNFHGYYTAMSYGMHGVGCMILEQMDRGDILSNEIDK